MGLGSGEFDHRRPTLSAESAEKGGAPDSYWVLPFTAWKGWATRRFHVGKMLREHNEGVLVAPLHTWPPRPRPDATQGWQG